MNEERVSVIDVYRCVVAIRPISRETRLSAWREGVGEKEQIVSRSSSGRVRIVVFVDVIVNGITKDISDTRTR